MTKTLIAATLVVAFSAASTLSVMAAPARPAPSTLSKPGRGELQLQLLLPAIQKVRDAGGSSPPPPPPPPAKGVSKPGVAVPSREFPLGDIPGDVSDPRDPPPPPPPPPPSKGQIANDGIGDMTDAADDSTEAKPAPPPKPPTRVGKAQNRRVEVKLSK
jgi:hypothetical protein